MGSAIPVYINRSGRYDGFPTLGAVYDKGRKVENARTTTHLGSGGGSFSPASIFVSRNMLKKTEPDKLTQDLLKYVNSNRKFN